MAQRPNGGPGGYVPPEPVSRLEGPYPWPPSSRTSDHGQQQQPPVLPQRPSQEVGFLTFPLLCCPARLDLPLWQAFRQRATPARVPVDAQGRGQAGKRGNCARRRTGFPSCATTARAPGCPSCVVPFCPPPCPRSGGSLCVRTHAFGLAHL